MISVLEQKGVLKELFREVILEVIHEERISFYDSIFPNASKEESEEVNKMYGTPQNYSKEDFKDMSDWIASAS